MNFGLHLSSRREVHRKDARDGRPSHHSNSTQRRRAIAPSQRATLQPRKHKDEARQGNAELASTGRAGFDIVPDRPPGGASRKMSAQAQWRTGLPRRARCGLLSRLRDRPPGCHRCGRSPLNPHSAGERVRLSSRSEDGSDRSQARVGRGAQGALAINQQATTPMVRRWAAGTPMRQSGPEGRGCGT